MEVVTTSTVTANITVGYMKAPDGEDFTFWDSQR
jgi:hypothetical protein